MKIECVIVSLNYSDFLSHTLPHNRLFFNKTIVVTDNKDVDTKRVCDFWNVECVQTDDFYIDSSTVPNKARGINAALKKLDLDGWVLQLDADIYLLPQTRNILEKFPLEEEKIYGIDRLMCNSFQEWYDFMHNSKPIYEGWIYCHTDRFPIGTRIVQYHGMGYMPIGYFQLWNPQKTNIYDYPIENAGFDRTDVVHLKRWDKSKIGFIPDLVCIHLASENHAQGQNWLGRKTPKFGPTFIEKKPCRFHPIPQLVKRFLYNLFFMILVWLGFIKSY